MGVRMLYCTPYNVQLFSSLDLAMRGVGCKVLYPDDGCDTNGQALPPQSYACLSQSGTRSSLDTIWAAGSPELHRQVEEPAWL